MPTELTLSQEVQSFIDTLDFERDHDILPDEAKEAEKARNLLGGVASEVIKSRETISEGKLKKGIEFLVQSHPELVNYFLDEHYTREVVGAVSGYVRRTMQLSPMEAASTPSDVTNTYLREATRTFVLGLPQACIALCRAALEQSLKERLGHQLSGSFVMFRELLEEAEKWHLLDKVTKRIARDLAKAADDVLHEKPTTLDKARELLDQLRGLLQHIYSSQGHY